MYRGIALSSCVAKEHTAVLNYWLNGEMDERDLHMSSQGGFTRGKRTTENLYFINTIREGAKRKHKALYCVFPDVAKAYNSIDRGRLGHILAAYMYSPYLSRAIMSSIGGD